MFWVALKRTRRVECIQTINRTSNNYKDTPSNRFFVLCWCYFIIISDRQWETFPCDIKWSRPSINQSTKAHTSRKNEITSHFGGNNCRIHYLLDTILCSDDHFHVHESRRTGKHNFFCWYFFLSKSIYELIIFFSSEYFPVWWWFNVRHIFLRHVK